MMTQHPHRHHRARWAPILILGLAFVLAGCGGMGAEATPIPTRTPLPTFTPTPPNAPAPVDANAGAQEQPAQPQDQTQPQPAQPQAPAEQQPLSRRQRRQIRPPHRPIHQRPPKSPPTTS